jgi:hypothetical protein
MGRQVEAATTLTQGAQPPAALIHGHLQLAPLLANRFSVSTRQVDHVASIPVDPM